MSKKRRIVCILLIAVLALLVCLLFLNGKGKKQEGRGAIFVERGNEYGQICLYTED